jgi:hypothetical protein
LTVSNVVAKNKDLVSPRGERERYCLSSSSSLTDMLKLSARDDDRVQKYPHTRGKSPLTPRRAREAASRSSDEVTQATSYGDIQDSSPATDHVSEEEPGSYDDGRQTTAVMSHSRPERVRASRAPHDEPEGWRRRGLHRGTPHCEVAGLIRTTKCGRTILLDRPFAIETRQYPIEDFSRTRIAFAR